MVEAAAQRERSHGRAADFLAQKVGEPLGCREGPRQPVHEILVGRKVHLQGRALNGSELCDLHKLDKPQESLYSFHQLTLRSSSRWTLEPEPLQPPRPHYADE